MKMMEHTVRACLQTIIMESEFAKISNIAQLACFGRLTIVSTNMKK